VKLMHTGTRRTEFYTVISGVFLHRLAISSTAKGGGVPAGSVIVSAGNTSHYQLGKIREYVTQ